MMVSDLRDRIICIFVEVVKPETKVDQKVQ